MWYKGYTGLRFHFDAQKDRKLRKDPNRGIGFVEAEEIFRHRYFLRHMNDIPEQFCATGRAKAKLYSVIYEVRNDDLGEYYHLVTLWKATKEEIAHYEENA